LDLAISAAAAVAAAVVVAVAPALLGARAHAQPRHTVRAIEKSYEVVLGQVAIPTRTGGAVSVRPCAECAYVRHALAPDAAYAHNGRPLSFAALQRLIVERRRTARPTYVGVAYDVATNAVTRIAIKTE
jgi:hypothetical protein